MVCILHKYYEYQTEEVEVACSTHKTLTFLLKNVKEKRIWKT